MKKTVWLVISIFITLALITYFISKKSGTQESRKLSINYPYNNTVFPADITAPTIKWSDNNQSSERWKISLSTTGFTIIDDFEINSPKWCPSPKKWEKIVKAGVGKKITIIVKTANTQSVSRDSIQIFISEDKVEAPIFFRSVPLPFKFARENLKRVRWHLGSVSNETKPHIILDNIPVCANCHSFTHDGQTIAMDVDARDDKGAYAITSSKEEILFANDSIIHWSDYDKGKFTYGLLSRISPDGRYVVSTLRDCEIFVDRKDLEYSQLFFPFKGILVVYDRIKKEYFELEGANDTMLVQSNPCWSPDGKFIYYTQAKAKHYKESGIHNGSVPRQEDIPHYKKFEEKYLNRDTLIKFNIYKVPFNNGKGGKAVSVKGASHNGYSNYFPKISPDGKWLVFCRAESFMLLQKDSKLFILPTEGGEARQMTCNTNNMNSWHSWSPNSKWLVFSTKALNPYTQLFLTHINEDGTDSPPVHLEKFSFEKYANNIPEFVNTEYNKEMKINPDFLSEDYFIVRIGEIKEKEGDLAGAFEAFDKAVTMFPDKSEPYYKRGNIHFHQNHFALALIDFSKAINLEKLPDYYTMRGMTYLKLNEIDNVISDLTTAAELDPAGFTPMAYLGVAYIRNNNYNKAVGCLEKAVELYDKDPLTFYYLGYASFYNEHWKQADEAFTTALKLNLQNVQNKVLNEMRGKARLNIGDYKGAINDFEKALQYSPNNSNLLDLLEKAKMQAGKK